VIYSYQKCIDSLRTVEMALPVDGTQRLGTELATVDGVTYVYVPDTATLAAQSADIAPKAVEMTPELEKAIKAESPHVRLINARLVEKIRARYSIDDELMMLRLIAVGRPSPESDEYDAHVEACLAWGQEEKARLGFSMKASLGVTEPISLVPDVK
jgi:hypothetical protein